MDAIGRLCEEARHFGIPLSDRQVDRFRLYLDELWEWNRRINLTGVNTRERVVMELFLDSLMPLPYLPERGKMLDVGSGAGFPGLPLKICLPEYALHIVEPNGKKVGFMKQVIRVLGLEEVQVLHGRIGVTGSDPVHTGYDVVTAKALAPFKETVKLCAPFVRGGGLLVGFLGSGPDEALGSAEREMAVHGMSLSEKRAYRIQGTGSDRWICIIRKAG